MELESHLLVILGVGIPRTTNTLAVRVPKVFEGGEFEFHHLEVTGGLSPLGHPSAEAVRVPSAETRKWVRVPLLMPWRLESPRCEKRENCNKVALVVRVPSAPLRGSGLESHYSYLGG